MASYTGNFYLTEEQMQVNAKDFWRIMSGSGWTMESVCGMLGNMETESTINPGIWQDLNPNHAQPWGYGLVQWTPSTPYFAWCNKYGLQRDRMETACAKINYEFQHNEQWIPTSTYPMTFAEFKTSTDPPGALAMVFLYDYERPADLNQPKRATQAEKWYAYLKDEPPGPEPPPIRVHNKMPVWMYLKRRRFV